MASPATASIENHGFLEYEQRAWNSTWLGMVNLRDLLRPDDGEAARTLFIPTPSSLQFKALFSDRGLPSNVSNEASADWQKWRTAPLVAQPSWASWTEISAIVWEELSAGFSAEPPERFKLNPQPNDSSGWLFDGLATESEVVGHEADVTWVAENFAYRRQRKTRRQIFDERQDWRTLLKLGEAIAGVWGPEKVRLVMWFS